TGELHRLAGDRAGDRGRGCGLAAGRPCARRQYPGRRVMSESIRTPLGKVRGLGAAREGAHHFITQRVTAIALLFLVPWFLSSLTLAVRSNYNGAISWIGDPINAVLILLTVGAALYHMRIGMQVVIEDYIGKTGTRMVLLILNTFFAIVLFAAAAFAVLKIAG